jgi:polyhydroxyalkanoate synthesis regulator phasin
VSAAQIARHYVSEWDGDEADIYANLKSDIEEVLHETQQENDQLKARILRLEERIAELMKERE